VVFRIKGDMGPPIMVTMPGLCRLAVRTMSGRAVKVQGHRSGAHGVRLEGVQFALSAFPAYKRFTNIIQYFHLGPGCLESGRHIGDAQRRGGRFFQRIRGRNNGNSHELFLISFDRMNKGSQPVQPGIVFHSIVVDFRELAAQFFRVGQPVSAVFSWAGPGSSSRTHGGRISGSDDIGGNIPDDHGACANDAILTNATPCDNGAIPDPDVPADVNGDRFSHKTGCGHRRACQSESVIKAPCAIMTLSPITISQPALMGTPGQRRQYFPD